MNSAAQPTSPLRRLTRAVDESLSLIGHALGHAERLVGDARRDTIHVTSEAAELYSLARGTGATLSRAIKATPRLMRISGQALAIVASYRVHLARASHLDPERAAASLDALHRKSAARARRLCVEAGGGLVKIGQLLSCRADLLPAPWVAELSTLQDDVPPADTDAVIARLEADLGAPLGELFASFEREPVASASLAQVHLAVLPSGQPVAVKILRPGIEAVIDSDLATLAIAATALGDLGRELPIATIAREVGASLRQEIDLAQEAESLRAFGDRHAEDERVVVPAVIDEHTRGGVLTMSRVVGARLTDFLDTCEARGEAGFEAIDSVFATLIDSFAAQILRDGHFHADPHPGNIMVLEGPRVALLDFGATRRISPEVRHAYAEIMGAVLRQDPARLAEVLTDLGFTTRGEDPGALERFSGSVLEMVRAQTLDLASVDPMEQLQQAIALARDNPVIELPGHFVMMGRVLSSLGGPWLRYKPRTNLLAIIAGHLTRSAADTTDP